MANNGKGLTDKNQTPDAALAEGVVAELRKKKLLTEKQLGELPAKLLSGRMRAEDWQVMVELAVDAEAKKNA
jgi:hypothetical protein